MFCCPRCSMLSTIWFGVVSPQSGATVLNNVFDDIGQCGQQNIVQTCSNQAGQVVYFLSESAKPPERRLPNYWGSQVLYTCCFKVLLRENAKVLQ